jgi:hypothetical protein
MCACVPYPQVGSTTDAGWFYFSPYCDVSLGYAHQNAPGGGGFLIVKVLVGRVSTFHHHFAKLCRRGMAACAYA